MICRNLPSPAGLIQQKMPWKVIRKGCRMAKNLWRVCFRTDMIWMQNSQNLSIDFDLLAGQKTTRSRAPKLDRSWVRTCQDCCWSDANRNLGHYSRHSEGRSMSSDFIFSSLKILLHARQAQSRVRAALKDAEFEKEEVKRDNERKIRPQTLVRETKMKNQRHFQLVIKLRNRQRKNRSRHHQWMRFLLLKMLQLWMPDQCQTHLMLLICFKQNIRKKGHHPCWGAGSNSAFGASGPDNAEGSVGEWSEIVHTAAQSRGTETSPCWSDSEKHRGEVLPVPWIK